MYFGIVTCSKCYNKYEGSDYKGNLCPKCSKIEQEKEDKLNKILYNTFIDTTDVEFRKIIYNFFMENFKEEFQRCLISEFEIKIT